MAYQALYRKYRPRLFSELLGQDHITTILKNQVQSAQVSHAYLFTGTRGTGKTSTAKILARAVNCEQPMDGEPCGVCPSCIQSGDNGADIIELDAASNTGVDDMRALIEKARFAPLYLRTKVYIIDEAHMLTNNAFNALLKTLEEPPPHVLFILATTEPQRVPATIISRCQRLDFHRISVDDILINLRDVLQKAGAQIDEEGMLTIARAAEGGMRDALSIADQCIAFCGNNVTAEDVYSVLGSMNQNFLFDIADALIDSDRKRALSLLDKVISDGRDLGVFAQDLARHFRALLLARLCGDCSSILDCTPDAMKHYIAQSARSSDARLSRAIDVLLEAGSKMKWMVLPRVQLECALVRITAPEAEPQTLETLLERIEQLEARPMTAPVHYVASTDDTPPWQEATEAAAPPGSIPERLQEADEYPFNMPEKAAKAQATEASPATAPTGPKEIWKKVLDYINKDDQVLALIAMKSEVVEFTDNLLTVGFDSKPKRDAFMKDDKQRLLNAALEAVAPGVRVNIVLLGQREDESRFDKLKANFGDKIEVVD